jgi:hypothetical protein
VGLRVSAVAKISEGGLATGLGLGTTTIKANYGKAAEFTFLDVTPPTGAVRFVIFIEDQQFGVWFGPEVVAKEQTNRIPPLRLECRVRAIVRGER